MPDTWSDKRMENWAGAARDIAAMCARVRAEQDSFLVLLGLTMEQARRLPQAGQNALDYAWRIRNEYPSASTLRDACKRVGIL